VGDFEAMYQAEQSGGFDSWHQSDPRRMDSQVASLLAGQIGYRSVLDLGCGKGSFTATLARHDTEVTGVDLSATAIAAAQAQFPDLQWVCAPVQDYLARAAPVDLIVAREVFSYLRDWREVLARCAELGRYLLIGLYVPPDPIGFVASHAELEQELERHAEILDAVILSRRRIGVYLAASP
jgi:2-polyprenyl-3-methyl-5-hydroxy-6-metoxy-1,4-benzoquinol methylase